MNQKQISNYYKIPSFIFSGILAVSLISCKGGKQETVNVDDLLDNVIYTNQINLNKYNHNRKTPLSLTTKKQLANNDFIENLMKYYSVTQKIEAFNQDKNFQMFSSLSSLQSFIFKSKLQEYYSSYSTRKLIEFQNRELEDHDFIKYLLSNTEILNIFSAANGDKKLFMELFSLFEFRRAVDSSYEHYLDIKTSVLNHKKNKFFISHTIEGFPYNSDSLKLRGQKKATAEAIRAVEKYLNDITLTEKEEDIINNFEIKWHYNGNYIRYITQDILEKLAKKNITEEEKEQLFKLMFGPSVAGISIEGLNEETGEMIAEALKKRDAQKEVISQKTINFEKKKADYFLKLMLVILFSTGPVFAYAIRKYRADVKIFTDEEKQIINDFLKLRKIVRKNPQLLKEITELELAVLNSVDNPMLGNISEIQKKLKIIMSKYNESHLCAVEKIKHGKYYELRKRQSPRKYGGEGKVLLGLLANHYGINQKKICVFDNGSSDGLAEIIKEYGKDKNILVEVPTYGPLYDTAKTVVKSNKQGSLFLTEHSKTKQRDLDSLGKQITDNNPGLVILCNPGNPFGQFTRPSELYEFCNHYPNTVFLIDEAYLDFYEAQQDEITSYSELPQNVICLRTFSKMHGLAGLRIGYAISSRKHIKKLESFPFMEFLIPDAEYSAAHSIDQYDKYVRKYIKPAIADNLEIIEEYKANFGETAIFYPDAPNMILLKLPDISVEQSRLLDLYMRSISRVYVNFFGAGASFETNKVGFGDETYIRISLLDKKTNEKILKELIKALNFVTTSEKIFPLK